MYEILKSPFFQDKNVDAFVRTAAVVVSLLILILSQKNFLTSDTGIIRDADSAILVESDGRDFAGASSAVFIVAVVPRHRIVVVVVDVRAGLMIVVERQIRMIRLNAVVQNRNYDALAGVTLLPGRAEIHVVAVLGAAVLREMSNFVVTIFIRVDMYETQCRI